MYSLYLRASVVLYFFHSVSLYSFAQQTIRVNPSNLWPTLLRVLKFFCAAKNYSSPATHQDITLMNTRKIKFSLLKSILLTTRYFIFLKSFISNQQQKNMSSKTHRPKKTPISVSVKRKKPGPLPQTSRFRFHTFKNCFPQQ